MDRQEEMKWPSQREGERMGPISCIARNNQLASTLSSLNSCVIAVIAPSMAMASISCSTSAVLGSAEDMSQKGVMPYSFDGFWLLYGIREESDDMGRCMLLCYY